jgi:hypothetical protein
MSKLDYFQIWIWDLISSVDAAHIMDCEVFWGGMLQHVYMFIYLYIYTYIIIHVYGGRFMGVER